MQHACSMLRFSKGINNLYYSSGLNWVFVKLLFRDGLVWTVGLTVEIKLRFRDGLVWTVGLTVEIKLRFRDGLVWTVGLTVEIKLRFQIPPGYWPKHQTFFSTMHRRSRFHF